MGTVPSTTYGVAAGTPARVQRRLDGPNPNERGPGPSGGGIGAANYVERNRNAVGNGTYIKRTRVFVNSNERIVDESRSGWTFTIALPEEIDNVVAIELYQYNASRDAGPTFSGVFDFERALYGEFAAQQNAVTGKTPTRMDFPNEAGQPFFEVLSDLDPLAGFIPATFSTGAYPVADYILTKSYLFTAFQTDFSSRALVAGITPPVISNYASENGTVYTDERMFVRFQSTVTPGNFAPLTLKYGTGIASGKVDSSQNTARQLGFNPYRDTQVDANSYTVGDYLFNNRPYRYLEVFVDEIDELQPVARIPLVNRQDDDYVTSEDPPRLPRILIRTVERLWKMHVRLRLEGDRIPPTVADTGTDLVFDVYSIAPIQKLPDWINQTFTL